MDLRKVLTRHPLSETQGVLDYVSGTGVDYCENFGDQWNRFRSTQIDSLSGTGESRNRFLAETGWQPDDLKGKVLLDAGCGAGRFAEIALECGAYVVAVDISAAAYACRMTLSRFPPDRYLVLRANLFDLPLSAASFDGVYSLGVLQHTPDPLGAIERLAPLLAPGGRLATWIYERSPALLRLASPRLYVRAATSNWSDTAKLKLSRFLTAAFFPFGWGFSWLGHPGAIVSSFLPYACRHHHARGHLRRQWEYCLMDTFDWYGPKYEIRQTERDVKAAYMKAGLKNVQRTGARGMAIIGFAGDVSRTPAGRDQPMA